MNDRLGELVGAVVRCRVHGAMPFLETVWCVHSEHPRCGRGWWWIAFCPRCDHVIAGENAPLGVRVVRVGGIPSVGHPFVKGAACVTSVSEDPDIRAGYSPR